MKVVMFGYLGSGTPVKGSKDCLMFLKESSMQRSPSTDNFGAKLVAEAWYFVGFQGLEGAVLSGLVFGGVLLCGFEISGSETAQDVR